MEAIDAAVALSVDVVVLVDADKPDVTPAMVADTGAATLVVTVDATGATTEATVVVTGATVEATVVAAGVSTVVCTPAPAVFAAATIFDTTGVALTTLPAPLTTAVTTGATAAGVTVAVTTGVASATDPLLVVIVTGVAALVAPGVSEMRAGVVAVEAGPLLALVLAPPRFDTTAPLSPTTLPTVLLRVLLLALATLLPAEVSEPPTVVSRLPCGMPPVRACVVALTVEVTLAVNGMAMLLNVVVTGMTALLAPIFDISLPTVATPVPADFTTLPTNEVTGVRSPVDVLALNPLPV